MFGKRSDGKKIKNIEPYTKIMPHLMNKRCDAQNFYKMPVNCEGMDKFIDEQRALGESYNYFHITVAAFVRLFAQRPQLNRFIMNGRIFKRNKIMISFAVKKKLSDDAIDTTIKLEFDGTESIAEVKEKMDNAIKANATLSANNKTDKTAKMLTNMPNCLIKMVVGLIKFMDKHGMCPKAILNASPFHTSGFVTNLKSIKANYIYHHLYDFGTTSIFIAMGKEKYEPVVNFDKEIVPAKIMQLGIVTDERFCDGFYYVKSMRLFETFFNDPSILLTKLDAKVEDVD